ncbi:ldl35 [Euproctis pseudoconspersa nucleopolyhedrovirus]|uniref:Ldl35 n=1 Tax=Euproctis pseudoconspersa nucleopolyhedrovirus TaxID=307467 RepID=C3TX47_9ABAC|nr:ldl35 [Euproctis pseudoconspersa nucleopolyhedrovirus]ACO53589.1 ldl35 [Euproctis pseudoconspersa nucleopolyhedrovirus]QUJ09329.1 ld135 protein [Gynaephora ruoergensis nucleopolyhedrovirus]
MTNNYKNDVTLQATYLDYIKAAQKIIKFVVGFVKNKDRYVYEDYKIFIDTLVDLIKNLVDDYMTSDAGFKLWALLGDDGDTGVSVVDRLIDINQEIKNSNANDQIVEKSTFDALVRVLKMSCAKMASVSTDATQCDSLTE